MKDEEREKVASLGTLKVEKGPLEGIPLALKDNFNAAGERMTCASKMLESFVSPFSSTVWQRLEDAGALLMGKVNLDEFAMGSHGKLSAWGPTRNPRNVDRSPGGSSSGSAAA